ncbi:MAG: type II toxin-antitoxin system antitoxin SocA domain-containing protein [Pseudomonadota bacterium]
MSVQPRHPTRAMAVANWFLERSWNSPELPHCDQMKLYKLVFYAHGWFLGNKQGELFPEDVEAWPHGPVVRDLYVEFKDAGRGPIRQLGKRMEIDDQNRVARIVPKHDGSLTNFFESVWNVYGGYTGIQLSNMTHRPGEPWTIVAQEWGYDLSAKPTITTEIIEAAFEQKVRQQVA